ncbi:unnamed protein product [Natator depressus]
MECFVRDPAPTGATAKDDFPHPQRDCLLSQAQPALLRKARKIWRLVHVKDILLLRRGQGQTRTQPGYSSSLSLEHSNSHAACGTHWLKNSGHTSMSQVLIEPRTLLLYG